jgi:hypothetical protein
MLYHYNPTGQYFAGNALLAPEVAPVMAFTDKNPKTGGDSRFTFDRIEFSYFDPEKKGWQKRSIDLDTYAELYGLVAQERSVDETSEDVVLQFTQPNAALLILFVRTGTAGALQEASKPFQQIHFANEGDYFRVSVQEQGSTKWVYFRHPNIYQNALNLLTRPKTQ